MYNRQSICVLKYLKFAMLARPLLLLSACLNSKRSPSLAVGQRPLGVGLPVPPLLPRPSPSQGPLHAPGPGAEGRPNMAAAALRRHLRQLLPPPPPPVCPHVTPGAGVTWITTPPPPPLTIISTMCHFLVL